MFKILLFLLVQALWLAGEVEDLVPQVVRMLPHDPSAFTQGLAIDKGILYESTGLYGQSSLRQIDLQTGIVLQRLPLPSHLFGEGIACLDGRLIQLTWKEGLFLIYTLNPLKKVQQMARRGEGWGLCADSDRKALWMSDGTDKLYQLHSRTFSKQKILSVQLHGQSVSQLNDIVCVGKELYANIWKKDSILRINKETGEVTAVIDASQLLPADIKARLEPEAVLNGLAYREETQTFFLTGKYWPLIFEVRFIKKSSP